MNEGFIEKDTWSHSAMMKAESGPLEKEATCQQLDSIFVASKNMRQHVNNPGYFKTPNLWCFVMVALEMNVRFSKCFSSKIIAQ
jgi:hypothetical protein